MASVYEFGNILGLDCFLWWVNLSFDMASVYELGNVHGLDCSLVDKLELLTLHLYRNFVTSMVWTAFSGG